MSFPLTGSMLNEDVWVLAFGAAMQNEGISPADLSDAQRRKLYRYDDLVYILSDNYDPSSYGIRVSEREHIRVEAKNKITLAIIAFAQEWSNIAKGYKEDVAIFKGLHPNLEEKDFQSAWYNYVSEYYNNQLLGTGFLNGMRKFLLWTLYSDFEDANNNYTVKVDIFFDVWDFIKPKNLMSVFLSRTEMFSSNLNYYDDDYQYGYM